MDKGGEQRPEQTASRKDYSEGVDGQGTGEVLPDSAADAPGHPDRFNETDKVVAEQHHIGTLSRHIRARAHRNSDAGLDQGRRIVHAVADHGNHTPIPFNENPNALQFFFWERFCNNFLDAELACDGFGHRFGIAREQDRAYAHLIERVDGFFIEPDT